MATIKFSTIVNGSSVVFNPATDILSFDTNAISAASLSLAYAADYTGISITAGGKTFSLPATVSLAQLTTSNVTFADGSRLIIGDNTTGTANDALANVLIGTKFNDQLLGLAGNDTLAGGAGNDVLNGGNGADLMKGGLGADTYIVDNTGDVVDETPTTDTRRISVTATGVQGDAQSFDSSFSPDGRYVVFGSFASNLVSNDTNGNPDIFVKDLQTGELERISTASDGVEGNNYSQSASFSADGRYVVFESAASNLVSNDTNYVHDIFVKDLQTGAVQRVSTDAAGGQGNGYSYTASFSGDGRVVVFQSTASNLVAGDSNGVQDIFVKNLQSGAVQRVSTTATGAQGTGGNSANARFSTDGRYVVFESTASNLVAGDTNAATDIFVKDLQSGAVQRVSTTATGAQGTGGSSINASFSADGRYVVFESAASNLVAGDSNGKTDIFIKDLQTGAVQRVSTDAAGGQGYGHSASARFSTDGRYVVFQSESGTLVAGDTLATHIFVKDLQTGAIQRVSTDAIGLQGNFNSFDPEFSSDGRYVVFASYASNLVSGDTNSNYDVFRVANPFYKDSAADTVRSSVSYTLPNAVENLVLTGTANLSATGNALNNSLTGNTGANNLYGLGGNDTLNGGAGADSMTGGDGNDVYYVDNTGDKVVETNATASTGGYDTVYSYLSTYSLVDTDGAGTAGGNVENGRIMSTGAANLTGNSLNNVLYAGSGNNILDGSTGTDTASYLYAGSAVTVSLALTTGQATGGSGTDTLLNLENLTGSSYADKLTGSSLNNVLEGGLGNDTLDGGAGSDTAAYVGATSAVTVSLAIATAQNTVSAGTDTLTSIENLTGSNYNDKLTGNTLANRLNGGLGNDVLDGGAGIDTMTGGDGSDIYYVRDNGDLVSEANATASTGGTDHVLSYLSAYTLGANVENGRILATGAANLTGNSLGNTLYAGAGNNVIDGGAGTDTVSYAYGLTGTTGVTVSLAVATAQTTGGSGSDALTAIENLTGSNYADTLTGNGSANVLNGGGGNDVLTGGAGNDIFRFSTTLGATNVDTISGGYVVADDSIQLENTVFAKLTATGPLAAGNFVSNATGTAADADDYIIYESDTGILRYDADGNGAGAAVQFAVIGTNLAMAAAEFTVT